MDKQACILKATEAIAQSYDAGFLAGKNENVKQLAEFRKTYVDHLHNLIQQAISKGEFESVVYARQLLRSLSR